jgi:hypothetical protein
MANRDSTSPKYRIDVYELDGGESWSVEVYAEGEDVISLDRMFITNALDDAVDHVIDLYEEEYDTDEDF